MSRRLAIGIPLLAGVLTFVMLKIVPAERQTPQTPYVTGGVSVIIVGFMTYRMRRSEQNFRRRNGIPPRK